MIHLIYSKLYSYFRFTLILVFVSGILGYHTQQVHAQQQYKVITVIESIVSSGLGRSRIIDYTGEGLSAKNFTTERTDGEKSSQNKISRSSLKVNQFKETKLLNFYNMGGINFQNIASNDAIVSAKLTELAQEGWTLAFVTSGVESDGGKQDGQGIYVTRYVFSKE